MDSDQIGSLLDTLAPASLAESWDNPGWQVRVPAETVSGILLTLDVTTRVLEEASNLGCNLLFAHHPLFFRPVSSLDLATPVGSLIAEILRRRISVWAAHTNLDVMPEGTSFALAKALGLEAGEVLAKVERQDYKLVVYVPPTHVDLVKEAMAQAGAGEIGNYSRCFWQVLGTGQFRPELGASPYQGRIGEEERVEEFRVEGVVPKAKLGGVLEAMRRAHPYEEVAYDLVPLANRVSPYGFGAVGSLASPKTTLEVAQDAARRLSSPVCQIAGDQNRKHQRVAVMGGSGAGFLDEVVRQGATLFITADVRYHNAQEAVAKGLDLVVLDHFATEYPVLDAVRAKLEQKLPGLPVRVTAIPSTPFGSAKP